jgi:hypothetical protein
MRFSGVPPQQLYNCSAPPPSTHTQQQRRQCSSAPPPPVKWWVRKDVDGSQYASVKLPRDATLEDLVQQAVHLVKADGVEPSQVEVLAVGQDGKATGAALSHTETVSGVATHKNYFVLRAPPPPVEEWLVRKDVDGSQYASVKLPANSMLTHLVQQAAHLVKTDGVEPSQVEVLAVGQDGKAIGAALSHTETLSGVATHKNYFVLCSPFQAFLRKMIHLVEEKNKDQTQCQAYAPKRLTNVHAESEITIL